MNTTTTTTSPASSTERRQALSELLGAPDAKLNLAYAKYVKGWALDSIGANAVPIFRDKRGVTFACPHDFVAELGREAVLREVLATFAE